MDWEDEIIGQCIRIWKEEAIAYVKELSAFTQK
jgi:hypothetical protein